MDPDSARTAFSFGVFVCILPFAIAVYFLPSFIAFYRDHHQRFAILMLNIFAGWTFIAWAASIVWAFTSIESKEHVHHHYHHP